MPNLAALLKSEMSRIARKELRGETLTLRKASSAYRKEIAALKRRTEALEQRLRQLSRASAKGGADREPASGNEGRFSARSLASQRRRLGLSAADCGLLIGASAQSVYNWEEGRARPREKHMPAIFALRSLGKRQAAEHLASMRSAG